MENYKISVNPANLTLLHLIINTELVSTKEENKFISCFSLFAGMHFSVAVASVQQHVGHIKVGNSKLGIFEWAGHIRVDKVR